ncbi:hypothetical protein SCA6_016759 [Theobroma cacao]
MPKANFSYVVPCAVESGRNKEISNAEDEMQRINYLFDQNRERHRFQNSINQSSSCHIFRMATTACFIIVSRNDIPIYEAEVGSAAKREDAAQLHQFILHAALDIVQDLAWTTSAMFLKAIDRFNDLVVSVYVTAGHILYIY